MGKKKHLHKYRRVNIGHHGKEYWVMKCVKEDCTHYTPMYSKLSAPLLKGSIAECNRCGESFILDKRALRMELPCCEGCVMRKERTKERVKSAEDFFSELEKDITKDLK